MHTGISCLMISISKDFTICTDISGLLISFRQCCFLGNTRSNINDTGYKCNYITLRLRGY